MVHRPSSDCAPSSAVGSSEWALAEVVDQIAARLQCGEPVSIEEFTAQCPHWAEPLRRLLPALEALSMAPSHGPPADHAARVVPVQVSGEKRHQPHQLDDFELLREAGRGGMGIVYEARQISLARRVAVKVLPRAGMLDPRQLQRFQNEARAAAQLNHPHIVDAICVGCAGGVHYFAMRFVDGQTLAQVIGEGEREGTREEEKRRLRVAAEWIAQAAEALEHAHTLGIVHRDVKPSNLLIDRVGKLWVTDFGLARFGDEAGLTMTGDLLGTLRYMSPEQALGQRAAIDHRSDIYALGATLYELLALRPVFDGADRSDLLRQLVFTQPRPLRKLDPRIPRDLETIALKALEKAPADRFATAGEMAADLRRFLRGEPIQAKPPTLAQRTVKWCLRHRGLVAASAAGLLLVVVGLAISTLLIARSRDEAVAARQVAEDRDRENRRMLSAIETRSALQAYQRGELTRASELLERQVQRRLARREREKEEDFRDFTWHLLRGMINARCPQARSFDDYPSEIAEIDYSPDGALLAAACERKIILREVDSGLIRHEIEAHDSLVTTLDFSPNGALLASVGNDHRVRLWNVATGKLAADLGAHECEATAVGFSRDGSRLAPGDNHGLIRIWDVAGRHEEKVLTGHVGKVDGTVFADSGTLIAVSDIDHLMICWDVDAGQPRWKLQAPHTEHLSLAVSHDGTTIAASDRAGTVGLWNVADGRELGALGARPTPMLGLALSPDGRALATGGDDGFIQLWDMTAQTFCGQMGKHRGRVRSAAFSPNGQVLATSGDDRSVRLWDVTTDRQPRKTCFRLGSTRFAFSATGELAMTGDDQLWRWQNGAPVAIPNGNIGNENCALAWLGNRLVLTKQNGELSALDLTGTSELWAKREQAWAVSISISSDGEWVALRGFRQTDREESSELCRVRDRTSRYRYVGTPALFSSDSRVAFFIKDNKVLKLELASDSGPIEIAGAPPYAMLALSRDDRRLALGNFDSTIELIDLQAGSRRKLTGHERAVAALDFSPDGLTLASGAVDGTLRLWRVDLGETLGVLERRKNGTIEQVAFLTRWTALGRRRPRGNQRDRDVVGDRRRAAMRVASHRTPAGCVGQQVAGPDWPR